ncbi:hypothetical protein [Rhizobium miluonense]|uniref:Nucleotidyl transferase AbiEii toxin, Type IV TA system n=1 Tax=Rhizobium miluonense TaxID=411945 RepID=A0ABU1SYK2_9HYPH|nr:hypothetical protein [Rhizobium miluonense]MDR6904070.1 hypothetical protein [Rhizobium miluonense]
MTRDKNWALDQLRHQRNAFLLTLASLALLHGDQLQSLSDRKVVLKGDGMILDPDDSDRTGERFEFEFQHIVDASVNDTTNFDVDLRELFKFARRNLVKEGFEVVKAFATVSGISEELEKEDWYPFAYVVRNAISHNMLWEFQKKAKKMLPITWKGVTIAISNEGQELSESVLSPWRSIELIFAMRGFVERH